VNAVLTLGVAPLLLVGARKLRGQAESDPRVEQPAGSTPIAS
jgi:hypothetical protein